MTVDGRFGVTAAVFVVAVAAATALHGCGSGRSIGSASGAGDDSQRKPLGGDGGVIGMTVSCATPQEGCACENIGEAITCGQVERRSGNYVSCSLGQRTCTDNHWGGCVGDRVSAPIDVASPSSKKSTNLGSATTCLNDPCDPYCVNYIDSADGLDAGSPLAVSDAGLTLEGHEASALVMCLGMVIVPTPQSITVTGVSPLATTPPFLQFNASLTPDGCFSGYAPATWALSDDGLAVIDKRGVFSVYAAVASTETITGYAGSFQGSATAQVKVDIVDNSQAPSNTVDMFAGTPMGGDSITVLYPYNNTVFPRGLKAPVVQWSSGGVAADAVKISLRYPSTGPTTFSWTEIISESAVPTATIPQAVWAGFDQTAKGQDATLAIQRIVAGTLHGEIARTVHFTTDPLRGQIYYTEYARTASNPLPSPSPGGACKMGNSSSVIRSLDPSGTSAPTNPFASVAPGGCPVCHSVSANGKMFVTSNRGWGAGGGVSRINSDGTFTPIADSPQPPKPGADSRGFAFGAVTPNGTYVLQGSNLWGNTKTNGNVGLARLAGGNGNGLHADYFNNVTLTGPPALSRIDQTVNFDWGAGSPDPAINADGFAVRWYGKVQPYEDLNYTFEVQSDDGVRLWIDNVLVIDKWADQSATVWDASVNLLGGKKYDIKLEYYESTGVASAILRWASSTTQLQVIPETQLYGR